MKSFKSLTITGAMLNDLRQWLETQNEVFEFSKDLDRSSLLISHLIRLELAGPNNNLARHLVNRATNAVADSAIFGIDTVIFDGLTSVRVSWPESLDIKVAYPNLADLCDTDENSLFISPAKIALAIKDKGIEPVIVKKWLAATMFSDFDPATMKYRDQMWELENNDVMLYAQLVANRQMVFQGIHDVVEHAPGTRYDGWEFASQVANEMNCKLMSYFNGASTGNIPSHIPPYLAGIILDDLTQSRSYSSLGRAKVIQELIDGLIQSSIVPHEPWVLKDLPNSLDAIMDLARTPNIERDHSAVAKTMNNFFNELKQSSYLINEGENQ